MSEDKKIYCYIRVSTDKQEYIRQIKTLKDKGYLNNINCKYIEETYTGAKLKRPMLEELLQKLNKGDTLVCESLSRLSRGGVIKTLELITELIQTKKVNVNILHENFNLLAGEKIDANTNLLLGIFSVLSQFERDLISERTHDALMAKKQSGVILGRPTGKYTTMENFIKTLELQVNDKLSIDKSTNKTFYPKSTFQYKIKQYQKEYGIIDKKVLLNKLKGS